MQEIGAFAVRNALGAVLDRVERGEEIVITRHGKPAARLVPIGTGVDRAKATVAADRIRARSARRSPERLDWSVLKSDRDEGRP